MKFVLSYTLRSGGTAKERVDDGASAQKLLANWSPSGTIHQWVQRCDGSGGFAVIDIDDAAALFRDLDTWTPWLDFQVFPVIDIADAVPIQDEVLEKVRGVL